jgi:hypothetical protein
MSCRLGVAAAVYPGVGDCSATSKGDGQIRELSGRRQGGGRRGSRLKEKQGISTTHSKELEGQCFRYCTA